MNTTVNTTVGAPVNDTILRALAGKNFDSPPPIWLMRQAGRYLPSYRALRARHSFLTMCHTPELIAEVTQLPLRCFPFDAAILFSDILVVAEALGVGLRMEEEIGPVIERPVRCQADVDNLPNPHVYDSLGYVREGIALLRPQLNVPLLGFAGAPFTVASYMIEGRSSLHLQKTKRWMMAEPASFHQLLSKIAAITIDYLQMQIDSGVQAIQLFDSWAHQLAPNQFQEFSLAYMKKIMDGLKARDFPVILFCRGSALFARELAALKPAAISIDWSGDLAAIRRNIAAPLALQGNLDPFVLFAPKEVIKREVSALLQSMQGDPAYIFNLGHGIQPDTPMEAVELLVDLIKNERWQHK